MAEVTSERGITRPLRHLLSGMSSSRVHSVRSWLRTHPGHLGPNPDLLVVGLLAVILVLAVTLAFLGILGSA